MGRGDGGVLSDDPVVRVSSQPRFRRVHCMTHQSISPLRWRVIEDMTIRKDRAEVQHDYNHRQGLMR